LTNIDLAQSYLLKASSRLKILDVLLAEADYSDVIREAQEVVELATKAMLRRAGIDPPKWHDVGSIIWISSPARSTPASRPRSPSPTPGTSWSWPAGSSHKPVPAKHPAIGSAIGP